MSPPNKIDRAFYARSAREVARDLLGKLLVKELKGELLKGKIVETEAYCDGELPDLACHGDRANNGKPTSRTRVMFGPPGYAYVYFTYGVHWMFNIVTGVEGEANAVLVRALEPVQGLSTMAKNRNNAAVEQLTNGPAKLAQAMRIERSINGADLCSDRSVVWLEAAELEESTHICAGPRIGLGKTPEPWLSVPWRYWIQDNQFVSK